MKYILKGRNDFMFDLEEIIFENRGIEKEEINNFKNVSINDTFNPYLLKNMQKGIDLLTKHINNKSKIHIIVDSDADGVTSSAIMYNYLSKIYLEENISWSVHDGKQHGIILEELKDFSFDLLIVPDAGTNDIYSQNELTSYGIDILILDHHIIEVETENDKVVVINSKDNEYPNNQLSGAGVVYKFCQALDGILKIDYSTYFIDLVSIGLIGDMVDVRVLENKFYIKKGLDNIKNNFLKELIKKQSFSINVLNINSIAFYIVPLLNAVFRIGTSLERKRLFQSFIDNDTMVSYKKRGSDREELVFLYENMARETINIKNRQKREQEKYKTILKEQIESYNMDKNNILLVNAIELDKNFNGLMANALAQEYNKPTLVLSEKTENICSGSGRNFNQSPMLSFKEEIEKSELCDYIAGHDNAFGVSFKKENLKKLIKYFNMLNYNFKEKFYYVDFVIEEEELTVKSIKEINKLQEHYGHGFEECLIVIKNIVIENVFFNEKMTVMSFVGKNNIKYVKFFPKEKEETNFLDKKIECNLIGKVSINSYNDTITYQFIIEDYEVLKELEKNEHKEDDFIW